MESTSTGELSAPTQTRTTLERIKSVFSGSVDKLVGRYDWYVYVTFSPYFAVGFLMYPIGGWLMGIYADRKGALTVSVLLMCFGSLMIALTPSYETIGVAAPVLLIVARLLQGLSAGGEYGTSATYLSEKATKERRGFFFSFQYVMLISGQVIALAVLIILQQTLTIEQLETWGLACAVRDRCNGRGGRHVPAPWHGRDRLVQEDRGTEGKHHAHPDAPSQGAAHRVGQTMGGTLASYTYTTYMQKYLVNTVGMSKNGSIMISAATLFLQPLVCAISDKIGRHPILVALGGWARCSPTFMNDARTRSRMNAIERPAPNLSRLTYGKPSSAL